MSTVKTPVRASLEDILVATDFSDRAHLTAQFAALMARACGRGRICFAHVIPLAPLAPIWAEPWAVPVEADIKNPHDRLRNSISDIDFAGLRLSFEVRAGELATVLEDICVEESTGIIALATSGREGLSKILHGSIAESVMRRELCPVLVVGPHVSTECMGADFQRVLFATDFGAGSVHALEYALEAARAFGAVLTAVNVVDRQLGGGEDEDEQFLGRAEEDARQEMKELLPAGIDSEALVEAGVPWESIVQVARERNAKLIVMGRRPHSPLFAAHTPWTTAHRVICHAPCPVLTVR